MKHNPLNILVIEDVEDDYVLLQRNLKKHGLWKYGICVENIEELKHELYTKTWDIVISDNSLPQLNALDALKITKQINADIPFIIVSGTIKVEEAILAMKEGAADYLMKDNLAKLIPVVQREAKEARNRQQHKNLESDFMTFIYRCYHDLRGPIASLLGLVQIAYSDQTNLQQFDYLDHLARNVRKMDATLTQLLQIFAIREIVPQPETVSLAEIFEQCKKKLWKDYRVGELEWSLNLEQEEAIYTDKFLLKTVVEHILTNAIHYRSPARTLVIELSYDKNATHIELVLKDNGVGIPMSVLPKVFQMFYRGNEQSTGNGLGLYIVKTAVEKLGGQVAISSSVGIGTEVYINFPCIIDNSIKTKKLASFDYS
ncbi:hybrid sensor histidine kinase/response regulator [Microscilla marina]|uniref:histidine kinase n=1 Tax=Microscilla marina ATCC 23134 TaxID=313606 RepID=A1ZC65_MICM2|nr:hybrid sensor histidine kinase/response regulator [Microscilla marina]EAY31867.1 PAS sensor diguanylate cyclase/phophodiesterase [Microscilla marina ATCC 23134]